MSDTNVRFRELMKRTIKIQSSSGKSTVDLKKANQIDKNTVSLAIQTWLNTVFNK